MMFFKGDKKMKSFTSDKKKLRADINHAPNSYIKRRIEKISTINH